jgi:biopolymer transport protein TolR
MGASIGTEDARSRNVDLNIVPFIDLMVCLTAFLLVTAVWVDVAQVSTRPAGKARDGLPCDDDDCNPPRLSVLVEPGQVWIGISRVDEFEIIPRTSAGYDWHRVAERLRAHRSSAVLNHTTEIEIAADSTAAHPIAYEHLVAAMDVAVAAGFVDVGISDVRSLSARPHR